MRNDLWVAMLNEDMHGEHMAIVQYVLAAYALGEGAIACSIEGIARDEMRHWDWLADEIVELGGKPTLERNPLRNVDDPALQAQLNVKAEEDAIGLYEQHIAAIEDVEIQRLLRRIVNDEQRHKAMFQEMVAQVAVPAPPVTTEAEGEPQPVDAASHEILNAAIKHEYTVILQYLFHSVVSPDCPIGREIEMQAINEMQHLGWLSETLGEAGGKPEIEHTAIELGTDTASMLAADIAAERAVTHVYHENLEELKDPALKELIARIRTHEIYHDAVFTGLLDALEASKRPSGSKQPTVGSLKKP